MLCARRLIARPNDSGRHGRRQREDRLARRAARYAERGLPELITVDFADYEALALRLARNDAYRAAIRKTLAANRHSAPLFEADILRRNMERAYSIMIDGARRGERPIGFDVDI